MTIIRDRRSVIGDRWIVAVTGHDLYGRRFKDFQRILAQLRAKDMEREVQAILDRHPRPFGGEHGSGIGNGMGNGTGNGIGNGKSVGAGIGVLGRVRARCCFFAGVVSTRQGAAKPHHLGGNLTAGNGGLAL